MGAKIVLSGEAKDIQITEDVVSFNIITGPATRSPPSGLELYGPTRYHVQCTARQWGEARQDPEDRSALLVEGYLEPRRDEGTGQLYIAVAATTLQSTLAHNRRRLEQLEAALQQARDAFSAAREMGAPQSELEEKAQAFVKANAKIQKLLDRHPELASEERV
jgi:hypothetical protein